MAINYTSNIIFSAIRVVFWYVLLFGLISPLFLPKVKNLDTVSRLIYSWMGMGGILLAGILGLTLLNLYDYIGILALFIAIPLLHVLFLGVQKKETAQYLNQIENSFIVWQVRALEFVTRIKADRWVKDQSDTIQQEIASFKRHFSWNFTVLFVASVGSIIRLIPAFRSAAPYSNDTLFMLSRVKDIGMQHFWGQTPDPSGTYALANLFSLMSQISPEMIIHLFGALISFVLCLVIYWSVDTITGHKSPFASLFGMTLFALFSTTLMPISLAQQISSSGIYLALSFGIPTILAYGTYLKNDDASNVVFFVVLGLIATGLTNLFVYLAVVLPTVFLEWLYFYRNVDFKTWARKGSAIVGNILLLSVVYGIPISTKGLSAHNFIQAQLLNTDAFVFTPSLLFNFTDQTFVLAALACLIIGGCLIEWVVKKRFRSAECLFSAYFLLITTFYLPQIKSSLNWVDFGQLDAFYAVLIAVFGGLVLHYFSRFLNIIFKEVRSSILATGVLFILATSALIGYQGGIKTHNELPKTEPDGFYRAYFKIIQERLPWTYSIVAPDVDQSLSKDRHYFMDYNYFLSSYSKIDSLYHAELQKRKKNKKLRPEEQKLLPAASIFVFVAKPPYDKLRESTNFDPAPVMKQLNEWLQNYRQKPNRTLNTFYESQNAVVYEIDNQSEKSKVNDLLYDITPSDIDKTTY